MQFIFSQWVRLKAFLKLLITLSAVLMSPALLAHGVAEGDKGYIQEIYGV
ncbi:HupE/UreJ family protein, partial [Acinetobacter baumannii]